MCRWKSKRRKAVEVEKARLDEARRLLSNAERLRDQTSAQVQEIRQIRGDNGFGTLLGAIYSKREGRRP